MPLRLYDTLTRQKRAFVPLDPGNVRMYVCGPTVYDFAHIGNARPVIVFDVLFRLLRHLAKRGTWDGGKGNTEVTYVRNITDVDDKINDRAARDFPGLASNEAIRRVTEVTAAQFQADVKALGCLEPTFEPRATDFVSPRADGKTDMVTLIKQLVARGHAYEAGGEVLFDTASMPDYGALSGRRLEDQRPGARVAVDVHKKNPLDFVLWKQSSENEPGWESPWGRGRPGWHIECSAMSAAYLDKTFDIHGGGLDLTFPHHENEIAQSRCAHGTPFMAKYWMHNGYLQVEGEKMSKSLGNFVTIHELLQKYFGSVLRFTMLKTHYREPIDWTGLAVEQSRQEMGQWADLVHANKHIQPAAEVDAEFVQRLLDDLDTPNAITRLRELYKRAHSDLACLPAFLSSAQLLGLALDRPGYFRSAIAYYAPKGREQQAHDTYVLARRARTAAANNLPEAANLFAEIHAKGANYLITEDGDMQLSFSERPIEEIVKEKIELRNIARVRKDFKESDRIRDELAEMGVVLKDGKDASGNPVTTWEIAR